MVYWIGLSLAENEENKFVTCVVYCTYISALTNVYLQYVNAKVNEVRKLQEQTRLENIPMQWLFSFFSRRQI
jgi:hypothetical protein